MSSLNDVLSISWGKKLLCSTSTFVIACLGSVGSGTVLAQTGWWRCFQCGGKWPQVSVEVLGTKATVFPREFALAEAVQQVKHQQRLLRLSQLSLLSSVVTFHCATSLVFPSIYNVVSLHKRTDSSILRCLVSNSPRVEVLKPPPSPRNRSHSLALHCHVENLGANDCGKAINVCSVCHRSKTKLSQAEKRQHPDLKNSQSGGYVKRKIVCLSLWQQV